MPCAQARHSPSSSEACRRKRQQQDYGRMMSSREQCGMFVYPCAVCKFRHNPIIHEPDENLHEIRIELRSGTTPQFSSVCSSEMAIRYGLLDVIASYVSVMAMMAAKRGIASPLRPSGLPLPLNHSWWCLAAVYICAATAPCWECRPVFGMVHHFLEFPFVQLVPFAENRVRRFDLPDVMKQARDLELLQLCLAQPTSLPGYFVTFNEFLQMAFGIFFA